MLTISKELYFIVCGCAALAGFICGVFTMLNR